MGNADPRGFLETLREQHNDRDVAATVRRLFSGTESGQCWFVQPGREPAAFGFRNLPGPR